MASITVYNFNELKNAIEDNNGIDYINLGSDIVFQTGGIEVLKSKGSITLDGNGFSITDCNLASASSTIHIPTNAVPFEFILKNTVFYGRNYYGMVCVYDGSNNSETVFVIENVTYSGPQPVYHRYGKTIVIDSTFYIGEYNETICGVDEFIEGNVVEFHGQNLINSHCIRSQHAVFYLLNQNPKITLKENASLTVEVLNSYLIYTDNAVEFIMESNSRFDLTCGYGMFYSTGNHCFKSMLIDSNCFFRVKQNLRASGVGTIRCRGDITVGSNSVFQVFVDSNVSDPILQCTLANNISFNDCLSVVLYNRGGLDFSLINNSNVYTNAELINTWINPLPLNQAGLIDDIPLHAWRKVDESNIIVNAIINSAVNSNITIDDEGGLMNTSTYNLSTVKVYACGKLPLSINEIVDSVSIVSGETLPESNIRITSTSLLINDQADLTGSFNIQATNLTRDQVIEVISNLNFLTRKKTTTVVGSVYISYLPSLLQFKTIAVPANVDIIKRVDPNWYIEVSDSRSSGDTWELYAYIISPLSNQTDQLEIIIKDQISTREVNIEPILIYTGNLISSEVDITIISYSEIYGFLVELNKEYLYSCGEYSTNVYFYIEY